MKAYIDMHAYFSKSISLVGMGSLLLLEVATIKRSSHLCFYSCQPMVHYNQVSLHLIQIQDNIFCDSILVY